MKPRATSQSFVGSLEPIHKLLAGDKPKVEEAIKIAYLESLTREPTAQEMADAKEILNDTPKPIEGMADLRWAIFNSHEFRFLP